MSNQTVLRFQSGNSDKVWAYDPNIEAAFYGRFGSRLRRVDLKSENSFAKINEKVRKGYQDFSSTFFIEDDGTLRDKSIHVASNDNWILEFKNSEQLQHAVSWLGALKISGSSSKERDWLISEINNQSNFTCITVPKPSMMTIELFAALKNTQPELKVVDTQANLLTKENLVSMAGMSKTDMIKLEMIKEVKLFTSTIASPDAYF